MSTWIRGSSRNSGVEHPGRDAGTLHF
jgi:hypothetical protein